VSKNKKDQATTKGAATGILLIMIAVLIVGIILFSDKLKTSGMSLSEIIGGIRTPEEIPSEAIQTANASHPQEKYVPDEVIVKFKPDALTQTKNDLVRQYNATVIGDIPQIRVRVWKVNANARDNVIEALSKNPTVEYAEKNGIAEVLFVPNDPYYSNQWALPKIQADYAWNITKGNSSVKIAILDTGIDMGHPDLASKIVSATDFTGSPNSYNDVYGHGTHCAGIAAAITNNSIGTAGTCPGCSLMNVKVISDIGFGQYSSIANGIIWAADNGANVISMSLGGPSPSSAIEDAINYAWNKGVVVVASAGNSGNDAPMYPAYYTNSIAVAATDSNDALAYFSNYGKWVDIAAPGLSIYSTCMYNSYCYRSGTSMACPHVAGLAGLLFATTHDVSGDGRINDEVRFIIEGTSDKIDINVAYGRINAYSAFTQTPFICAISSITESSPYLQSYSQDRGSTIYYNPASSSSFNVNVVAMADAGIQKVNFPDTVSQGGDDTTVPYSWTYNLDTSDAYSQSATVTCFDNNGSSKTTTLSVIKDTTPPSGGLITYIDGYTASVDLTVSDGTDPAGVNSTTRQFQRREAVLSGGNCGSFGSWSDISPTGTYPNFKDIQISINKCYQYQYIVSDNVLNKATYTSNNIAKGIPDVIPPTVSIVYPTSDYTFARKSTVTIFARATDNVAVTKVEFYVNGRLQCVATSPYDAYNQYICKWPVLSKSSQLQAKAYDAAGNTALSDIVIVKPSSK